MAGNCKRVFDVVSLGEPMIEFNQIPETERSYLQGFGGDTMNCAIAAARQGARVAFVSRVGNDEFGRLLFELLKREGVDASSVHIDDGAHTAVYFVSHGVRGHTFSYLRKNSAATRLCKEDLPHHILGDTRFLYASGITQAISACASDAVFRAIDVARSAGAQIVFDVNFRPALWAPEQARETIARTIPLTDYFLISLEDAQLLLGLTEASAILGWCEHAGAKVSILKRGPQGAIASNGGVQVKVDGFAVDAIDATGAGDCFAGALMARLNAGDDLLAAMRYACAAAALACTGFGAVSPLPLPAEVLALVGRSDTRSV